MSIFRISRPDDDQVADVDSIDDAAKIIGSGKTGRYHVDEISAEPLPSGTRRDAGESALRIQTDP